LALFPYRFRFPMRIALYQPDIPQNTGTILRLAACLNVGVDIIEPAGFDISDRALKRAALDYIEAVEIIRHPAFGHFEHAARAAGSRIVLLTAKAQTPYVAAAFRPSDILLVGRESAGVPEDAMVLGEGIRQTGGFNCLA
jgi:tRNA (cytidine/uridine-2'-O-)-methyltransferase